MKNTNNELQKIVSFIEESKADNKLMLSELSKAYNKLYQKQCENLRAKNNLKLLEVEKEKLLLEKTYFINEISRLVEENKNLSQDVNELHRIIGLFENSFSWKITFLPRKLVSSFKPIMNLMIKVSKNPYLVVKGARALKKHGPRYVINKIKNGQVLEDHNVLPANINLLEQNTIYILTTRHCFFIAKLIENSLIKIGLPSEIVFDTPHTGFGDGVHFVICPQMFDELPSTYIAYQLEQSVSSRWFTDDYIKKLHHSYAIFDYSLDNIKFLQSKGLYYQQMYYMPLAYLDAYSEVNDVDEEYDILFYGDANNERRREYLNVLSKKFKLKIVSEVFGEELYKEISKAKIVVNIHYYDGALLETTRLYECLSLNKMVVSETSSDIDVHCQLKECVDFVSVGNIDEMVERIEFWLKNDVSRKTKIKDNIQYLKSNSNWFEYYFMRFMLANDWLSFDKFYNLVGSYIKFDSDMVCLSLPESIARMKDFEKDNIYGFQIFPGLRHKIGWLGAGMSYKFMLKKAKEQKLERITICEDDVEFKKDFLSSYKNTNAFLSTKDNWDIFSGLIADLHDDVNILNIEKDQLNKEYIYLDKMTSMVFNIYSSKFYDKLLAWDEKDHNVEFNAIDRFIENHSTCVTVTTAPYMVGHKEDLNSTLWGANNSIYSEMIKHSELKLLNKLMNYKAKLKKNEI